MVQSLTGQAFADKDSSLCLISECGSILKEISQVKSSSLYRQSASRVTKSKERFSIQKYLGELQRLGSGKYSNQFGL
jgi:hypothetical protein